MRTTKAISTVSFNTEPYLKLKLNELIRSHKISFWSYVEHLPEDDEGGKKKHIHLYLEPSKMIQTEDLREELKEFDTNNPDKPLCCLVFNSSKFEHWYMYVKHDKGYLASKGQSRKFQYAHDNIVTSDSDDLLYKSKTIDLLSLSPYRNIEEAQRIGLTFPEFFKRGTIPIQQVNLFKTAWELMQTTNIERNGYENHINYDENGEIIQNLIKE